MNVNQIKKHTIPNPRRFDALSIVLRVLVTLAAFVSLASVLLIVGDVFIKGVASLRPSLFAWHYTSDNLSMLPAIINTIIMLALSLVIAAPLGICAAIYLAEYARRGNLFVRVVRMAAETLSGVPSIIYGLFGMLLFVIRLKWGMSILAGAFTLAIMVLPVIMRTAEEALMSVPDSFREGSFGLGAGKLRTILNVVLPPAVPGILAGVILATGRIVGETAALIFTAGTLAKLPNGVMDSARTLSVHLYSLSREGLHTDETYATAVVLILMVLGVNALAAHLAKKISGVKYE